LDGTATSNMLSENGSEEVGNLWLLVALAGVKMSLCLTEEVIYKTT
jgi:hypothetical protein